MRFSAWFLTFDLPPRWLILSGHALQRVVPDFRPDQRLKVNDHDLKLVACQGEAVVCRLKVNDHDLKLVACESLFRHALKQNSRSRQHRTGGCDKALSEDLWPGLWRLVTRRCFID
jgi:hypothetical protein